MPELTGEPAGDLMLLNDGDLTYAKIRFDPMSLAALPDTLPGLADPLARALVWAAAADAVRDAWLPAEEFVRLLEAGFPAETELSLLRDLIRFATSRAADASYVFGGVLGALPAAGSGGGGRAPSGSNLPRGDGPGPRRRRPVARGVGLRGCGRGGRRPGAATLARRRDAAPAWFLTRSCVGP